MRRCFVAMDPTPATRSALIKAVAPLGALHNPGARLRLLTPDQLHITLAFLGPTADAQLPALKEVLKGVAQTYGPIAAELANLDAFPQRKRPRSIHACVRQGAEAMVALMGAIEDACAALGFHKEERSRVPHLTLVRVHDVRSGGKLCQWLAQPPAQVFGPVDGTSFTLFESIMRAEGSRYEPLARFALADAP